jgi:hypothetical protein
VRGLRKEPAGATVRNVGRLTTPVRARPRRRDAGFLLPEPARNEPQAIRGIANTVSIFRIRRIPTRASARGASVASAGRPAFRTSCSSLPTPT